MDKLELYEQGLIDREIADRAGLTIGSIWQWRQKNNLPPNGVISEEDKKKIKKLRKEGKNDKEIGEIIGWSTTAVGKVRAKLGIPSAKGIDEKKARKLYEKGYNDGEIADRLGVTRSGICSWRKRNGLPSSIEKNSKKRMQLYKEGYLDVEIAEALDETVSTVSQWRQSRGLERNKLIKDEVAIKMYKQGATDREIAEEFGVSPSTIWDWRRKNNLEPNNEPPEEVPEETKAEIEDWYFKGFNDKEIAEKLDISVAVVFLYRCRNDLPTHNPVNNKLPESEHEKRMKLYKKGLTDAEIAEHTDITPGGIAAWRQRNCLPSTNN